MKTAGGKPGRLVMDIATLLSYMLSVPWKPAVLQAKLSWSGASDASVRPDIAGVGGWFTDKEDPACQQVYWFMVEPNKGDNEWIYLNSAPSCRVAALELFGTLLLWEQLLLKKKQQTEGSVVINMATDDEGNTMLFLNHKTKTWPSSIILMQMVWHAHKYAADIGTATPTDAECSEKGGTVKVEREAPDGWMEEWGRDNKWILANGQEAMELSAQERARMLCCAGNQTKPPQDRCYWLKYAQGPAEEPMWTKQYNWCPRKESSMLEARASHNKDELPSRGPRTMRLQAKAIYTEEQLKKQRADHLRPELDDLITPILAHYGDEETGMVSEDWHWEKDIYALTVTEIVQY